MNAYVCVYRQPIKEKEWMNAWKKASKKPSRGNKRLMKYLRTYRDRFDEGEQGCFYDWGDDPSFFCAEEILGDVRNASWGVCRPDVRRSNLSKGDFVIFFCARQQDKSVWEYYYIGVGTVREVIKKRKRIWQKDKFVMYRKFYNLLTNAKGKNCEAVGYHKDWKKRAKSPYVIFAKGKTHFNIKNPLLVAEYRVGDSPWRGEVLENWQIGKEKAQEIFALIPKRKGGKKLRGSPIKRNAHQAMNLGDIVSEKQKQSIRRKYGVKQVRGELKGLADKRKERHLKRIRRELLEISKEIAGR